MSIPTSTSFAEIARSQHSVVFISADVNDYDTLLANLSNNAEAYLLNAEQDGVFQMAAILRGRSGLDSIHILSHGSSGSLFLGSCVLNSDNLLSYVNALSQIGSSLSETGDILLYGCNVAQGEIGFHFIDNLAKYTRANVAASTNLTGASALGGDWLLQAVNTGGMVKTNALQMPDYEGVLGVDSYTINFYAADPALNNGAFSPTYAKLTPAEYLANGGTFPTGSAANPLPNAQAYASPAIATNLDAVESLTPQNLTLGQIVPFFIEIIVGDNTGDSGTIVITPEWLTQTTTGSNFGFDPTVGKNGVLAAFVDTGDPQHTDTGTLATVTNVRTTILDETLPTERINSVINVSGLNSGDKIIVEVWVALKATIPVGATGDIQASIFSATVAENPITSPVDQIPIPVINVQGFSNILTDAPETVTTLEDTPATGNVLLNTVNPDGPNAATVTTFTVAGDATVYTAGQTATLVGVGSLIINSNGSYTFTPTANYAGSVPVTTYSVTDGLATVSSTLTIAITPVNDAPTSTNGSVTALEDTTYAFKAADFGFTDANDSPANNLANVIITNLPTTGALQLGGLAVTANQAISVANITGGLLKFVPVANGSGANYANFSFKVQDDGGTANNGVDTSVTANTLTINVTPVNDAPAGTNGTVTALEDVAYAFKAADFGFTDVNDSPANNLANVIITRLPVSGSLQLGGVAVGLNQVIPAASIANLTFTSATNANGSNYASFDFKVQDDGGTANNGVDTSATANTLTINVTPVNDAPAGTNGTVTALEDVAYAFKAADFGFTDANDSPANNLANVIITRLPVSGSLQLGGVAVGLNQVIPATSIANLTFTSATNANGSNYASFDFKVQDDGGTANNGIDTSVTANTLTINVTPVNDVPVAVNDIGAGIQNTVITGNLASNDIPSGDGGNVWTIAMAAGHGVATVNPDGTYSYTPTTNFNGIDSFTYKITDTNGDISTATVNLTVTFVNNVPVAVNDTGTGNEDTVITGNLATNDTPSADGGNVWALATAAGHGVATVNPDGTYSYTPTANFNGIDSFTYKITDANGDTSTAIVNLTINPVNDLPVAVNDIGAGVQNAVITGNLASNDIPSGDGGNIWTIATAAGHGVAAVNPDGTYSYTPTTNFNGIDSFTYKITDANGDASTATVSLTISPQTPPNQALHIEKIATVADGSADKVGELINYTMAVTNAGNAAISNVQVNDPFTSNEAPVLHGLFNIGDTNTDGLLNVGETWQYTASHTLTQAEIDAGTNIVNTATVTGDNATPDTATASTAVVQIPSLSIDKVTVYGTQTGDGLTGVIAGHNIGWDYSVTNTGNVSLSNVSVQDDNGTLTNNTDNFVANPVLSGGFNVGDTNTDGKLNPNETWHFTATGIAIASSYSNIGTASGTIGATIVTATDASSYVGVVDPGVPNDCDNHDDQGDHHNHDKPDDHGEQSACGDSSDHSDGGKPTDHGEQSACGDSSDHSDGGKPTDHGEQSACGDSSDHSDGGKPTDHGEQSACGDSSDHSDGGKPTDHGEQSACGDSSDHSDGGKPTDHGEQSACGDNSDHSDGGKPTDHGEQSACGDSSDHSDGGKPTDHGEQSACGDSSDSASKNAESHDQATNFCTQYGSDTIDLSALRDSNADDMASYGGCSTGYGEVNFRMDDLLATGTNDYGHSAVNDAPSFDDWSGSANHQVELVGVQAHQSCDFS